MKSSSTPLIFVGLFIVLISSIVFLLSSSSSSSKGSSQKQGQGGGGVSPSSGIFSESPVIQPVSVRAIDLKTLRIVSTSLVSSMGYFRATLFRDENLQNPYRYNEYSVAISFSQSEMTGGYTWTDIEPMMNPSTTYWLQIQETDADDFGIKDVLKVNFSTPSNPSDDPLTLIDRVENILKNMLAVFGPLIAQFAIGEFLAMTIKSIIDPNDPDGIARKLIEMTDNLKEVVDNLRLSRITFLSKVNIRFKIMFDTIFRLSVDDIVRIVGKIGMYIPNTLKKLKITSTELMERTAIALRNMTVAQVRAAAESIAIKLARGAAQVGKNIAMSVLNPVDFAFIAIGITAAVLDAENTGNMNDWNKFKTSDFLAMKEEALSAQMAYLRDELQITYPQINGPLLKMSNKELDEKIEKIEKDLMFMPTLDSISDLHIDYIRALSPTGELPTTVDEIKAIEDLQIMKDIRNLQDIAMRNYYRYCTSSPVPTNPRKGWYVDAFARQFFIQTFSVTANAEKLHRCAVYVLCVMEGGTPLHDSQCSFKTPSQCFASYPWPFLNYSEDMVPYESPKPCSTVPCLDDSKDFGVTDYVYSEWRTPYLINRDYPGGTDYTQDGVGGVCVITPSGPRIACEAATKRDPIRGIDTGQNYNKYTGECTNTKEYCHAFYVEYRDDMPTSEMANRGTGSLPSCFSVNEGTAMIIGGEIIVQYLQAGFEGFVNGIETLFGIRDDAAARQREIQRIADENGISEQRGDTDQLSDFMKGFGLDFLFSDVITMVDFKVDKEGNMYVMYAKGINNGTLLLVKYNTFFEVQTTNKWGSVYNDYFFNGPVEKCISSRIALDRNGNLYMIEFYTEYEKVKTKITKKFGLDGGYDKSNFTEITSDSIAEHWFPGKPMRQDNGSVADGPEINGIYIRNEKIYISFVAFNETDSVNISKIFKYDLRGIPEGDMINSKVDFLFRTGQFANEEVFSFVVDDNENIYTHFNTGTDQGIYRFDKGTGLPIVIPYPQGFIFDNPLQYWQRFPQLGISLDNKLMFSNSLRVWKCSTGSAHRWETTSIDLTPYLPRENPVVRTDDATKLDPKTPNYWEVCKMDLDQDYNIHIFAYKKKYINLDYNGSTFIKNSITEDVVFPVKNITYTRTELGVDFIKFTDVNFVNCLGLENIEVVINPLPLIKNNTYNNKTVSRLQAAIQGGDLYFPTVPNQMIFSPDVTYNISLKIDNKVVNSFTSSLNSSTVSINGTYTVTQTGDYCMNSYALPRFNGIERFSITFNNDLSANGTRVLKWKITRSGTSFVLEGDVLTGVNNFTQQQFSRPENAGTQFDLKLYVEGFESTKFLTFTQLLNTAKSCG
jgi:hypothetical protein